MIIMAEMAVSTWLTSSEREGADGLQFMLLFLQRNKSKILTIKNASRFFFMKRLFLRENISNRQSLVCGQSGCQSGWQMEAMIPGTIVINNLLAPGCACLAPGRACLAPGPPGSVSCVSEDGVALLTLGSPRAAPVWLTVYARASVAFRVRACAEVHVVVSRHVGSPGGATCEAAIGTANNSLSTLRDAGGRLVDEQVTNLKQNCLFWSNP